MNSELKSVTEAPRFGMLDWALLCAHNLRLLIVIPIMAAIATLGATYLLQPTFTASTRFLPPQQQQNLAGPLLSGQLGAIATMGAAPFAMKNPADLYVSMVKSRTVADTLLVRFKLREVYGKRFDQDARKELADRTKVSAGKDGLILIEVDDHEPKRAADIANAYVDALRELTQSLAITEAAQRRLFFEKQLKQIKDDLTRSEIALRASGISEASLKTMPQSQLEVLARLKAQATAQEVKLRVMREYMTESNPSYRQAQEELTALRLQLSRLEQIDPSRATASGAEYVSKFRDFKYHETLFEIMAKQYEMARLDEAREGAVVQVIDIAIPPERKSKPRRVLIAMVAGATTLLLLMLLFSLNAQLRRAEFNPEFASKATRLRGLMRFLRSRT